VKPKHIINIHGHLRHDQDIEARIRLWRECGVRRFCALALPHRNGTRAREGYFSNEDMAPWLKRYPDILVGLGALDLYQRPDPPEVIDRLVEQGFSGLKFIEAAYPYSHDIYFPLYARAEALRLPILFHTGWLASTLEDGRYGVNAENYRPYHLDRIARAFPELRIIGAHLGKPHAEEALQMITAFPNVYYDISGGSGKRPHVLWMLRALGPYPGANLADPEENPALLHFRKFCFATDNPEPPVWIEASDRIMDALQIPAETREDFYWRNAARIFGWAESDL